MVKEALALYGDHADKVAVIFSDVAMPEMDGYAFFYEAVKANFSTKTIPLMFISQLTTLDEKLKGYNAGGDDYLSKPVAPEEMLEKV